MPELQHIIISREGFRLLSPHIMAHIDAPSLKKLEIHGISETKDANNALEQKKSQTASFTSLSISDYEESPEATARLLQWPKALIDFRFDSFYNNRFQLSRWQMGELDTPAADAALLLAPNLKTFGWSFSIYDQHSESWIDFADKEEHWLREFTRVAIAKKSRLNKIDITFTPDTWGSEREHGYPWDRMDKIQDEIRPHGMTVKYNQPIITKEDWLRSFDWLNQTEPRAYSPISDSDYDNIESSKLKDLDIDDLDENDVELDVPNLHDPQTTIQGRDIRMYFFPI
ncbi:hypothetical protein B7463_g3579, partial [Scytalidium lignicola]